MTPLVLNTFDQDPAEGPPAPAPAPALTDAAALGLLVGAYEDARRRFEAVPQSDSRNLTSLVNEAACDAMMTAAGDLLAGVIAVGRPGTATWGREQLLRTVSRPRAVRLGGAIFLAIPDQLHLTEDPADEEEPGEDYAMTLHRLELADLVDLDR